MQTFTLQAVVLKEIKHGESDVILTLLSAQKGVITALARGVMKSGSKNRAALQMFCYSELEVSENAGRYLIKTAHLKQLFYGIRNDVSKYALACYVAETALHFASAENDETETLRLVLNTFAALEKNDSKPLHQIKAAYELRLCVVCGFMPEFDGCIMCGKKAAYSEDFCTDGKYIFSVDGNGLVCKDCIRNRADVRQNPLVIPIGKAVSSAVQFICGSEPKRFLSFKLDEDAGARLGELCEKYILSIAERNFETLKFYKTITR